MLIAIGVALLSSLMLNAGPPVKGHLAFRYLYTVVEPFAFFISMRYVIGLAVARRMPSWLCVSIWLFILWIVPTMVDAAITMHVPYSMSRTVFTWSPIISLPAALYGCWDPLIHCRTPSPGARQLRSSCSLHLQRRSFTHSDAFHQGLLPPLANPS
jgi:hypothetical protein